MAQQNSNPSFLFSNTWEKTSLPSFLEKDMAHVWCISLEQKEIDWNLRMDELSQQEITRAKRFRLPEHRERYIISHIALRQLLAHYLQCDSKAIVFARNQYGKPYLPDSPHLRFNLSHSHEIALCAFAWDIELGIDVERINPKIDSEEIANRYFCLSEKNTILQLKGNEKVNAFFNAWTRKEAFLKAYGGGLFHTLHTVEVTVNPNEPPKIIHIDNNIVNTDWHLYALQPHPNFAAALVTKGCLNQLYTFQFDFE